MTPSDQPLSGGPEPPDRRAALPPDLAVVVDDDVVVARAEDGRLTLVGGSPWRVLRLRPPADAVWGELAGGRTIGEVAATTGMSGGVVAALVRRLLEGGVVHPRWASGRPAHAAGHDSVTVVVPVHDRAVALDRLLGSVIGDGIDPGRIVVVDDGSTDGSGDVARARGTVVVVNPSPTGPAAARMRGLRECSTELVAFVDSDTVVDPGWLDGLLPHLRDPRVGAVAPRILGLATAAPTAITRYEESSSALDLGARPGLVRARTRVAYVPAAALLVRRAAIEQVGGFETAMHVGEDVDLVWRLDAAGWRVRYEPGVVVRHEHRSTLRAFATRRFQYGTSAAALDGRHPGQVPPVAVNPWSAAAWGAAMVAPPLGPVVGAAIAWWSVRRFVERVADDGVPAGVAADLARAGHLGAGRLCAAAVWRAYLPVVAAAALPRSPLRGPARRALVMSAIVSATAGAGPRRGGRPRVRSITIGLLDDAAYGAGVWAGAWRTRRWSVLRPDLTAGRVTHRQPS